MAASIWTQYQLSLTVIRVRLRWAIVTYFLKVRVYQSIGVPFSARQDSRVEAVGRAINITTASAIITATDHDMTLPRMIDEKPNCQHVRG